MRFGLSTYVEQQFQDVFSRYSEIESVLIFGSRAKGTFRGDSDIDLAVCAPNMSSTRFMVLKDEIDALPLVFKVDLLHWDALSNENLKSSAKRDGVVFYPMV